MATPLLMPKATAVWLVDSTTLTFDQIGAFCTLHPLEVQGIADGDVAGGIMGVSPLGNGQLTREEITKAEADAEYRMKMSESKVHVPENKRKGPRYTPISRRNERPGAIKWLVRSHPELKDAAIMRLVGTTKTTINAVRDGSHWNAANLGTMDPVTLGLCTQISLDAEVTKANRGNTSEEAEEEGTILMSAEEALSSAASRHGVELGELLSGTSVDGTDMDGARRHEKPIDAESVFSGLKNFGESDKDD